MHYCKKLVTDAYNSLKEKRGRLPGIAEVARAAGVSTQTVKRHLPDAEFGSPTPARDKAVDAIVGFAMKNGRPPTTAELAEARGCHVASCYQLARKHNLPVISPWLIGCQKFITDILGLQERLGRAPKQTEIAKHLGVSRQAVNQRVMAALEAGYLTFWYRRAPGPAAPEGPTPPYHNDSANSGECAAP